MSSALDILFLLAGGTCLYYGAEWMVRGASGLARVLGINPLVIGLTVVAYGTSAPELAVSASARLHGSSDIVLGNVIGSCIANLALILGVTALISPPAVDRRLIRREVPVLMLSALVVPLVLLDGSIGFVEAAVLLFASVGFTLITLMVASGSTPEDAHEQDEDEESETAGRPTLTLLTIIGLAVLVGGGELFVRGASGIATTLGMSERLVGLTIVAIGTSLPELAASIVAALRGYSALAVGNVVGSNIFNVFLVFGVVGLIDPIHGSLDVIGTDILVLLALTAFGAFAMRGARRISRTEGAFLLAAYTSFIVFAALG